MGIGKLIFSSAVERFFILLILIFAIIVFVSVALEDDLGTARNYILLTELVILLCFLMELMLKLCAVGWVLVRQTFLKNVWNLIDWVIVVASILLLALELLPYIDAVHNLQISAILRLFRLAITFRKANEFSRIHHKMKRTNLTEDFAVETAYERVLELLNSFLEEPWVKPNQALVNELEWCIDVISSNKLYETILTIRRESHQVKETDFINLVKIFSANSRSASSAKERMRRGSSLPDNIAPLTDLKADMSDRVLKCVSDIDTNEFNVFQLKDLTDDNELVTLLHIFFSRAELFLAAHINPACFNNFTRAVQFGYHAENPYHNSTHAADVVQTVHYMLGTGGVEEFFSVSPVELAGAYLAAAVHDFDHPGVNNNYLINTQSELAFRYNDRSVLESHHVASAFTLTLLEDRDPFIDMGREDYRHIRELMIEMVLSTDIAQHFSLLTKFKTMFNSKETDFNTEDRVLALSFLLHAADISNPCRPWELCEKWATLVMQEFWAQGDREREHLMDVSYLMDRYTVDIPKSQVGFIDIIVSPVFHALLPISPMMDKHYEMLQNNKKMWVSMSEKKEQKEVESVSFANTKDMQFK